MAIKHPLGLYQKQSQKMVMIPQMQQAITILQLPILELSTLIEEEIGKNPLFDLDEEESGFEEESQNEKGEELQELKIETADFTLLHSLDEEFSNHLYEEDYHNGSSSEDREKKNFLESLVREKPSLTAYLEAQAREAATSQEEFELLQLLIRYLSDKGYISSSIEEISTLHGIEISRLLQAKATLQTFEPVGIGAQNLQECLKIQAKLLWGGESLAVRLIETHFDDILHNRIPTIARKCKVPPNELSGYIASHIACLETHPGILYHGAEPQAIIPDALIRLNDDHLEAEINRDPLPSIKLNPKYLELLQKEESQRTTKQFIKSRLSNAKWLMRNLHQRNSTILRIAQLLCVKQKDFFIDPKGKLIPLTMKNVAEELALHESTIARAVAHKYIDTPKGIFPLRFFFSNALEGARGTKISSRSVKQLIQRITSQEDPQNPLSDEEISSLLLKRNIHCARRTIAKYRKELRIRTAQQRKRYL